MSSRSSIVESGEDAGGTLFLYQSAYDSIIKDCEMSDSVVSDDPPDLHLMGVHLICSRTYSSCSAFRVSSMKIC